MEPPYSAPAPPLKWTVFSACRVVKWLCKGTSGFGESLFLLQVRAVASFHSPHHRPFSLPFGCASRKVWVCSAVGLMQTVLGTSSPAPPHVPPLFHGLLQLSQVCLEVLCLDTPFMGRSYSRRWSLAIPGDWGLFPCSSPSWVEAHKVPHHVPIPVTTVPRAALAGWGLAAASPGPAHTHQPLWWAVHHCPRCKYIQCCSGRVKSQPAVWHSWETHSKTNVHWLKCQLQTSKGLFIYYQWGKLNKLTKILLQPPKNRPQLYIYSSLLTVRNLPSVLFSVLPILVLSISMSFPKSSL